MDFHLTKEQLLVRKMYREFAENVLIRKMVRAGKLGIKSGEGFFNYKK